MSVKKIGIRVLPTEQNSITASKTKNGKFAKIKGSLNYIFSKLIKNSAVKKNIKQYSAKENKVLPQLDKNQYCKFTMYSNRISSSLNYLQISTVGKQILNDFRNNTLSLEQKNDLFLQLKMQKDNITKNHQFNNYVRLNKKIKSVKHDFSLIKQEINVKKNRKKITESQATFLLNKIHRIEKRAVNHP